MDKEDRKKCPYCGELIMKTAKKCRYCGEWLDKEQEHLKNTQEQSVVTPKYNEVPSIGQHQDDKSSFTHIVVSTILFTVGVMCIAIMSKTGSSSNSIKGMIYFVGIVLFSYFWYVTKKRNKMRATTLALIFLIGLIAYWCSPSIPKSEQSIHANDKGWSKYGLDTTRNDSLNSQINEVYDQNNMSEELDNVLNKAKNGSNE